MIDLTDDTWWRTAVIYQIYPRSFADSNGDGIGDLPGITRRLDHVASLGADAIWLSPFYPSPQRDGGYDVADYRNVDPQFGTLEDFDALVARAHELALRVVVDLVPNHASADHVAFQAALAAEPGSAERGLFHFWDGLGEFGELPPNDWQSMFEGSAWTRVTEIDGTPGQWYLHLFDETQPDWNWDAPGVRVDFETTLRFWLDRGVDGFRVDVCDALIKAPGLPSWPYPTHGVVQPIEGRTPPMWDQEGIHEIFRDWRAILDSYEGSRILCAEAWLPPERTARIVRPDEMHQAFNFAYLEQLWDADAIAETIVSSLAANDAVGAPTTWVLSNHDVMRHASRFGYDGPVALEHGVGVDDPQPDRPLGLRRARAATLLMLALPGSAYLYQGEELGLPEVTDLPDEARQDPVWARSHQQIRGRDGCRVPFPWDDSTSSNGFSSVAATDTWLPTPSYYAEFSAAAQGLQPESTLSLYRSALAARRSADLQGSALEWDTAQTSGAIAFSRGDIHVVTNVAGEPILLPPDATILVASDPEVRATRLIARDTTVWFTTT
ncbi:MULTISPECIES: glycoside hydrolase family 13 protein [unclassified Frondihabitans]|uniref:glycoside hydrolase family 13 protein n=1 Tax=unclassified Frondihabitans TaxID=2626248 RepID=UPI000F4ECDDA|nr:MULTISPECIES: glycoside hydrolase family 13 protein [unclassified Frondihabitans]RPE76039.1 alpha-glucosidase [Frondihabitans sp. PhB153]RPF05684.1 alpha-glucosidase [Frondihabitans sp. PhB161]